MSEAMHSHASSPYFHNMLSLMQRQSMRFLVAWRWMRTGGAVLLVLLASAGVYWLQARDASLSNAPERRADKLALPPQESTAFIRLNIPFGVLRQAAERSLPVEFRQASEPGASTRYDLILRRDGNIRLTGAGDRFRVSFDLTLGGSIGLGGKLADLFALGEKNVHAAAKVDVDLGVTLDADWCPVFSTAIAYTWTTTPQLEVVGGLWISIQEQAEQQIRPALEGLPGMLREFLPCERIRETAFELWQSRNVKVQLPAAPPLHIGFTPRRIGISEILAEEAALQLVLALRAETSISSKPVPTDAMNFLPPLRALPEHWSERQGRLRLSVPIRAGYDMIRDWLMREFGGREMPVETLLGTVRLRVRDVFIYPSAPALAVAVTFQADLPGAWPSTAGRVVFAARPVLSRDGKHIHLEDLRLARNLDSVVWSLVTAVFEGQIRQAVSSAAVYDFSSVMAQAAAELKQRLSDPQFTGGLRVTLRNPGLRLENLVLENDALTVLGAVEANIDLEVLELPIH